MKRTAVIFSLIFCLIAGVSAEAQVRTTNTVYKFYTTLTGTVDTTKVTDTGSGSLYVKSWAGSADGVSLHFNVKKVSGDISGFRIYIYGSNNGTDYGSTAIDTIIVTNTAGTKTYVEQHVGTKFNAPYYRALFQGAGTGAATITYASIIGKSK
jgi:hypothetical protein